MLLARGWPGDCVEAASLLEPALLTAGALGMQALVHKAETLQQAASQTNSEILF